MSKQSRSRRNQPETPQTIWSLPSTAPLTPAPQPTVARAVQPNTAAPEQTASEPALEELQSAPLKHHLGGFSIFPETAAASTPPPSAPDAPPSNSGQPTVQASLRVNTPGDVYEQEADRMADLVMRSPAGPDEETEPSGAPDMPSYYVQRTASGAGLDVSPQVESSIGQMQGGGQPLPASERTFFENRFGHDFSQIRIHADDQAAQTSRALNARAFTVGTDIAFDSGEYQPGTESGRHLLAHELTHTIQQTGGVATKRIQRKAADEEAEEVAAPEEAPAEQKSPVDLVAEAAQKLSDAEVAQQAVPPVEAQPVDLPEHKPEDAGGSAGGGGGGGGEAAAAPAPAPEQAAPAAAATAEQNTAASPKAPAAPAATAPVSAPAVEAAPAPKSTEAVPAPAPAPVSAETSSATATPEAKAPTLASADKTAPETKAPAGETASAADQTATTAEANASAEEQTQAEAQAEADAKQAGATGAASEVAAAAPGAPDAGADEAGKPDDEKKRVQRMPSGRVIQRAPRSPEADPAFQAVTANVKTTAVEQKQHDPAQQKANEAAAAAKMPQEEKLGAAQNTQTTAIDAAAESQKQATQGGQAPGFDKEAFKASVKARIDQLTPKDPKQMENIEGSGVFGGVKSAVDQKVDTGKDQAQGNVDDKVKEAPNPGAVPDKPVTGLQPNAPGQAPGQIDASGAAPKAKGPEEVEAPLQAESKQLDTQMATAQITPEQLQNSNEPTFQAALQAKTSAQEHVQQALPQYRTKEQGQIQGAQNEAGALAQTGLGGMFTTRTGAFGQMDTLQNSAKGQDEQKRAEIGRQIDGIFQRTKSDVEGILTALDTQVDQAFTSGADAAKQAAIDYIKRETDAYKAKRYNQDADWWRVDQHIAGAATHAWDALTSMPDEYFEYYRQGRDLYVAEMDKVLDKVATIVGDHLGRAHQRVQQGRDEIKKFVEGQPEELREVAQQAAKDAESKFGDLEQTINSKQQEIVDSLAQKYVEKLQALDSELEQMKEAEKGLLAKAGDMINGVIKTIGELKDLLLSTLQRAAGAVMKILQDPIGFLGNLLSAVGQGLRQFVGNIGEHLKEGLISWLTGALSAGGIQLPKSWDLQGIFHLVMQILGLTYGQIRAQIVKALGPIGETVIGALEQAWEVFQIIQNEGIAGLWTFIAGQVGDLQAMVMDQIKEMVIGQVIKAGIDWLIGILGGPAGAFVKAVQAIVRVVTWFVQNAGRLASFVNSVLDSVMAIANGDIGGAASFIEQSLAKALPMVISFLADLLGLGGISQKVQGIIQKVKAPIQKGIDWVVQKAVALGKKLWGMLTGKGKDKDKSADPNNVGKVEGPLGKPFGFQAGNEPHRTWVEVHDGTPVVMVASDQGPLDTILNNLSKRLEQDGKLNGDVQGKIDRARTLGKTILSEAQQEVSEVKEKPADAGKDEHTPGTLDDLGAIMTELFNLAGGKGFSIDTALVMKVIQNLQGSVQTAKLALQARKYQNEAFSQLPGSAKSEAEQAILQGQQDEKSSNVSGLDREITDAEIRMAEINAELARLQQEYPNKRDRDPFSKPLNREKIELDALLKEKRSLKKGAESIKIKNFTVEELLWEGGAGIAVGQYVDASDQIQQVASLNEIGLMNKKFPGLVQCQPLFTTYYAILRNVLSQNGYTNILGGTINPGGTPDHAHHEEVIIRNYLTSAGAPLLRPGSTVSVGVSQNTVCGRCIHDLKEGKNLATDPNQKNVDQPSKQAASVTPLTPEQQQQQIIVLGNSISQLLASID